MDVQVAVITFKNPVGCGVTAQASMNVLFLYRIVLEFGRSVRVESTAKY